MPFHTNAGFVYYRTDEVGKAAPKTWEEIYEKAKSENGLVYQGARYEGLTVNFLELLYSGGGKALSEDGKTVEVDSEQGRKALEFMVKGVEDGSANKATTSYMEQQALRAFQTSKATYMRNWPYAYDLNKESDVKDKFDVATFPSFGGGEPAGVVGGYNLAISSYSKNPKGAAAFIDFATSTEALTSGFLKSTSPPAVAAAYDDPTGEEEVRLRGRPEEGRRAGADAARHAGLPAGDRGHLQERPRRPAGQAAAGRGPEEDEVGDGEGARRRSSRPMEAASIRAGRRPSKKGLSEGRLATAMMSPSLIVMALVAAYPIGYAVWLSLNEYSVRVPGLSRFAGLRNYTDALGSSRVLGRVREHVRVHDHLGQRRAACWASPSPWRCTEAFKGRAVLRATVLVPWAVLTFGSAHPLALDLRARPGLRPVDAVDARAFRAATWCGSARTATRWR